MTEAEGHSGSDLVDRALARLAEIEDRPVSEHADVLADVHRLLQDALATLDEA